MVRYPLGFAGQHFFAVAGKFTRVDNVCAVCAKPKRGRSKKASNNLSFIVSSEL